MYEISVETHFDAAHYLRDYQGRCESLHGHRYKVVVRINSPKINNIGLAYDFTMLKKQLDNILKRYDHTCLNDISPFDNINPSSENIALTIYEELKPGIVEGLAILQCVEVWESPDSWVSYSPN